jgi:hypothetical protein
MGCKQGGTWNVPRSRDDQYPAVFLLAAAARRKRMAVEQLAVQRGGSGHREPVIMSGSAVCGVPSASSGAP